MKDNALQEAKDVKDDLTAAISGANSRSAQLSGSGLASLREEADSVYGMVQDVPRNAMLFGLAGVLPYIATSATTIYLSKQAALALSPMNSTLDAETALALLSQVEGVQMAYGAVILSFIGSIHWGLEFAGFNGQKGLPRYMLGIAPVLIAMPTLLLEGQIGLAAQFAAFCATWFMDQRATVWGWAPKWYSTYRFWLTALVGSSLVVTLDATNYLGPGATFATTGRRLTEVNQLAADEVEYAGGAGVGTVKRGTINGEVNAKETDQAYVKLTNVRKKEEAERKQKEEEAQKAKEEAEKNEKAEQEKRDNAYRKEAEARTPGA